MELHTDCGTGPSAYHPLLYLLAAALLSFSCIECCLPAGTQNPLTELHWKKHLLFPVKLPFFFYYKNNSYLTLLWPVSFCPAAENHSWALQQVTRSWLLVLIVPTQKVGDTGSSDPSPTRALTLRPPWLSFCLVNSSLSLDGRWAVTMSEDNSDFSFCST